jgi:hypothetical protein
MAAKQREVVSWDDRIAKAAIDYWSAKDAKTRAAALAATRGCRRCASSKSTVRRWRWWSTIRETRTGERASLAGYQPGLGRAVVGAGGDVRAGRAAPRGLRHPQRHNLRAQRTYAFAERWTPWLEARGVKVVTVRAEEERIARMDAMALYYEHDYARGMGQRMCTEVWKLRPLFREVTAELERRGVKRAPGAVEVWLGITVDELARANLAGAVHPQRLSILSMAEGIGRQIAGCAYLPQTYSRAAVVAWLQEHGLEVPSRVGASCARFAAGRTGSA